MRAAAAPAIRHGKTPWPEHRPPAVIRADPKLDESPHFEVCDPQGTEEERLRGRLLTIEPRLIHLAQRHEEVDLAVASVDKSRQTAINKLGGREGAGNKALEAFWNIIQRATEAVDPDLGWRVFRISSISDEGISLIAGKNLPSDITRRFWKELRKAKDRERRDLGTYKYSYALPYGDKEMFELDLESFSRMLRHPEMLLSFKHSMFGPRRVDAKERDGFILEEIKGLENSENTFFDMLPEAFRIEGDGMAEVQTPFGNSLMKMGYERLGSGAYVEIKLVAKEEDARELLKFTSDQGAWIGTKKGFMEIFSRNFGMRGFNTFIGKPRTNSVITPIAHAMADLARSGMAVYPVNGSHLQYWVGVPADYFTENQIREAIEARISRDGEGSMRLAFEPSVSLLDANGIDIQDVRSRFILKSLGRDHLGPELLDMTDFLLNFIENIDPGVQERIFGQLSRQGNGLTAFDHHGIAMLRKVCDIRRTIRDTEDLIWVLDRDEALRQEMASSRLGLERWLFGFSEMKVPRMNRLLAEEAYREGRRR